MPDYKEMYKILFQAITLCINTLQQAQLETEELYISAQEPLIFVLPKTKPGDNEAD